MSIEAILTYYGCDPCLITLLRDLYLNIQRRFRYAGCVGSPWQATNGLLQGDPLSVVILNCVLCPLLHRLQDIPDLSSYAFADDLTIVSSTWSSLLAAYETLMTFCSVTDLVLNRDKCQIWTKGAPSGQYPPVFDRFAILFYPFLLGSPIDIGVPYVDSLSQSDSVILTRAKRISRLSVSYEVAYRLYVSLVSSCYNHYALACDITPAQCSSLRSALSSILVPKRAKWVCRESLLSLVTPGHLLSPDLFLNYRHIIEYVLYVQSLSSVQRDSLSRLWLLTKSYKWGPFFRLIRASKYMGLRIEDPFLFLLNGMAVSVDEPIAQIKHSIRDSYRQFLLQRAVARRDDCSGPTHDIDIQHSRAFFFSLKQPLHKHVVRYYLTGAIDHASRLFKSNLTTSPVCPFCSGANETAKHIFWDCSSWNSIREGYSTLMRFYSLYNYGFSLLSSLNIIYDPLQFFKDLHQMYLDILIQRHQTSQVLQQVPSTPIQQHFSSLISVSSESPTHSPVFVDTP